MAEGGGLLNRYRVKSSIGGSNPPLSASFSCFTLLTSRVSSSGPSRRSGFRLTARFAQAAKNASSSTPTYGLAGLVSYDSKDVRERFANGLFGFPFRQIFRQPETHVVQAPRLCAASPRNRTIEGGCAVCSFAKLASGKRCSISGSRALSEGRIGNDSELNVVGGVVLIHQLRQPRVFPGFRD